VVPQTTELFRDPSFWRFFRDTIIPRLTPIAKPKVLVLGCSSGDDLFSLLLLLEQAELLKRCEIVATEIDDKLLNRARSGILDSDTLDFGRRNYTRVVPDSNLDLHLHSSGKFQMINPQLLEKVRFKTFVPSIETEIKGKYDMVLCRNLLIYFNHQLQEKTQKTIHQVLNPGGILAIGTMETLVGSQHRSQFKLIEPAEKVYRRI